MLSPSATQILAWSVIALALAVPVAAFLVHYRRTTHYAWALVPFFLIHRFFTRIIWRTSLSGPVPVRDNEGAILIANHDSSIDPVFLQLGVNRITHWMVAQEYSRDPKMAWALRMVGAIPVSRAGVDTAATKATIRLAREGELVGLLPEGRINMTDELLLPGRPGAALIALRARVPVIPFYVQGAPYDGTAFGCFLMKAKVHVVVGQPLDLSDFYARRHEENILEELTIYLLREIAKLAGRPDYQPQVASGRGWSEFNWADWERVRRRMA